MAGRSYPHVDNGWIQPARLYWMCCCDCGLIHKFEFRVRKGKVVLRAWRDNRATAQFRRHNGIKVKTKLVPVGKARGSKKK